MKKLIKARKTHTCEICGGNIQKGEKYVHERLRFPKHDKDDNQIGVEYYGYRYHNKDCFPRLLHFEQREMILKNCNFGIHSPTYDMSPDDYDGSEWCEWCGKTL